MRIRLALLALWCLTSFGAARADETVVTLYYIDRPPLFVRNGAEVGGVFGDAARRVFEIAGVPHSWMEVPFARQILEFKRGVVPACVPGAYKTSEREAYARFTVMFLRPRPIAVLVRNNDPRPESLPDFAALLASSDMTLLVKTGYSYGAEVDAMIAGMSGDRRSTTSESAEMATQIAAGRGDYMLLPPEEGDYLINTTARSRLRLATIPGTPFGSPRHIMCSRAVPTEVIDRLNTAIESASSVVPLGAS